MKTILYIQGKKPSDDKPANNTLAFRDDFHIYHGLTKKKKNGKCFSNSDLFF